MTGLLQVGTLAPIPLSFVCIHDPQRQGPALWRGRAGGGPVVLMLLESRWKTGFASLVIHSAMFAGVVYATLHGAPRDDHVRMYTTVVLLAPQEQQKAADPPPVQLADALQGLQTVDLPSQIPTDIPPVDLQQRFDPKDYSGSGVEGGLSRNEVYAEGLVEERPALLSAPPPIYPALLKQAGIQGRLILPAVIDTTGRVEPPSGRILTSPHPPFHQPTKDSGPKAPFRPAPLPWPGAPVLLKLRGRYSFTTSPG